MRRTIGLASALMVVLALARGSVGWAAPREQASEPLWFGLRMRPELVEWFNRVAGPNDVAVVTAQEVALLDRITAGRKQVLFASVAEAEQVVPGLAGSIDIISYDLEHWPATPAEEQADPVAAMERMRALADQYGLTLGVGPDRRFALDYGAALAPFADQFALQSQRLQGNRAALDDFAQPLIQALRAANPEIGIVLQVRTEGTTEEVAQLVRDYSEQIDGIAILYTPTTTDKVEALVTELRGAAAPPAQATAPPVQATAPPPPAATTAPPTGTTAPAAPGAATATAPVVVSTLTPAPDDDTIWFGLRMRPDLVEWFNRTAGPNDVAAVTVPEIPLLAQITAGRRQVIFTSAAEAEQLVPQIAADIDIISYNIEHWPATPPEEQADPVAAMQRMRALADQHGLILGVGPDRRYALEVGAALAPFADQFALQTQRLQTDRAALDRFALPLIEALREANPELRIVMQVRTEGTVEEVAALVRDFGDQIDGIAILYTPASLDKMQALVAEVRSGAPTTAPPAATTTTGSATPPTVESTRTPGPAATVALPTPPPTVEPLPTPTPPPSQCLWPTGGLLLGGLALAMVGRRRRVP